ncbi:unnamed protein product [Dibothriocephalus latus]|uniref:Metalloendopeptidase n=1 Tax=Dibothriocephalus latus TaxID=60516 RepID=A0A3P7NVH6_DIBLA|nr:unnamed protein product [Dibothriocephalus latus]
MVSIGPNCAEVGIVMHELGHALGFYHEQSRPDRDKYVEIIEENIIPFKRDQFEMKDVAQVDSLGEPYDFNSVMHYTADAFVMPNKTEVMRRKPCCPGSTMGWQGKLSPSDIRQTNLLYKCHCKLHFFLKVKIGIYIIKVSFQLLDSLSLKNVN